MRNILINISANTIQVINALNNKLIQKIVNITSLFSNDDLEILLKYEESTLTLNYELIDGISIDGVAFYPPISYLDLLNQLQTIVVVKPLSSGGGSGGGDASSLNQLLGNSSLTAINNKLSNQATALKQDDTKSVLDNILLELKDDVNASETIWYDRITPTLFYIRRNSINQDTGVVTVIFYNVAGTVATPIISNLVQAISNSDFDFNTIERKAITNRVGYSINDRIQEL